MFIVYILRSRHKNWFYVGLTNDINNRLARHNLGLVKSTKHNRPYILIYTRKFDNRLIARDFEKYLKIRSNKEKLLRQLGYI